MRRLTLLLAFVPICFARPVAGKTADQDDAKERAALTACLSGDYTQGIALLTELFVESKDPTYIYNQGRCYEQNRRYDDAIARFQEYLRAGKKLSKADKVDAQQHIADCKELLASQQAQESAASVPAPAPAASPPQPQPLDAAPVVVVDRMPPPATASTGAGLRTAGVVTGAVGLAALAGGILLNLKVNSMADSLEATDSYSEDRESDRKTYAGLGWASYGLGAACLATGAVLYALGARSSGSPAPAVGVAPTLGPGHAGALVKGTF